MLRPERQSGTALRLQLRGGFLRVRGPLAVLAAPDAAPDARDTRDHRVAGAGEQVPGIVITPTLRWGSLGQRPASEAV